jgi:hypothetical protein
LGQNSKQRRDAKKRRDLRRPTTVRRMTDNSIAEAPGDGHSTVAFLASTYGRLPQVPECSGPVLIHVDGSFECHGTCEGATSVYHGEDALAPCGFKSLPTRRACTRCSHLGRVTN